MNQILKKPLKAVRGLGFAGLFVALATMSLNAQTGTIQIGSGTTNTNYNSGSIPIQNYVYGYSQQIVSAAEYTAGGGITGNMDVSEYW